jgi:hypothetical protein
VKKKDCQRAVGRGALDAAREAARNGKCSQADAIIAAAAAMGIGGRVLKAKEGTSCK